MEESSFFNSVNGDRKYDMEQFATYFKQFLTTGILHKDQVPYLEVSKGAGLQSVVDGGSAYIEGFMYRNTASKSLLHEAADSTNPRIDRVILKLNRGVNARSITAQVKKGVAATNPQPPSLQRDDIVYELSLAQVRINAGATAITSITDERLNTSVAGLVSSLITIPIDTFQAQWDSWFSSVQSEAPAKGGMTIYVQPSPPSAPLSDDIWIDTDA